MTVQHRPSARAAIFASFVVLAVSLVELLIADRKYGVFTGGFGQSRAVDTLAEQALFALGYVAAQGSLALLVWTFVAWLNRRHAGWPIAFHFTALFGGGFMIALVSQYQLHSYFSDAIGFTLIKQLGGGSLTDALLFGKNEIAMAVGALVIVALIWWGAWRFCKRRFGLVPANASAGPRRRSMVLLGAAFIAIAAILPRSGSDASAGLGRTLSWKTMTGALNLASDVDRDGYGLFASPADSAPFDAARHPLALDRPGNGIDEDGLGGDLTLMPVPQAAGETVLPKGAPNLIFVVFESTRFDVLGKRINGKPVAPNLEALVAGGSAIVPAYSHVGFTTDSLKSMFTGRLQPRKGDASLFTELRKSGYRIGVLSGQPEDFGDISETVQMRENAQVYVDAEVLKDKRAFSFAAKGSLLVDEEHLLGAFDREFGTAAQWSEPVFLYMNFQSAHFPYDHPGVPHRMTDNPLPRGAINIGNKDAVQATYWNAVANSDAWLGQLVTRLKKLGVWDNSLLVVTGDHGESLFEDGFLGHGHIINDRQYGTFFVTNRPGLSQEQPVAISDYRGMILSLLSGKAKVPAPFAPFMHVGPLDTPTQIGMATQNGIVSLRLDTGIACFGGADTCAPHERLTQERKVAVDALISRWGSERWMNRTR